MAAMFFLGELVLVSDGVYFEYANVQELDGDNRPVVQLKENTRLTIITIKSIQHIGIRKISLSDLGFYFMNDALLDKYHGPCYHCNLNNGFNAKIVFSIGKIELAKETTPGALERFETVETIGDIQQRLSQWFDKPCIIDANRVGIAGPRLLYETAWLNREVDRFLNGDAQAKLAAYQSLSRYLTSCVNNLDACRYWLSEYHIEAYAKTNDKSHLVESHKYLQAAINGGYCNYYRDRLAWVESELTK